MDKKKQNVVSNTIFGAKEIKLLIREFNPSKFKELYARDWIQEIETLGKVYNWNPYHQLLYASMRLTGIAKIWYEYSLECIGNWDDFKRELIKNFPRTINVADIRSELLSKKRLPNEPLEEYVHTTVMLAKKIKLSDDAIVHHLINGLKETNQQIMLSSVGISTPKEFLLHMYRLEERENCKKTTHTTQSHIVETSHEIHENSKNDTSLQDRKLLLNKKSSNQITFPKKITEKPFMESKSKRVTYMEQLFPAKYFKKIIIDKDVDGQFNVVTEEVTSDTDENWVFAPQMKDENLLRLRKILSGELDVPDSNYVKSRYSLNGESVHFESNLGSRYYLPKNLIAHAFLYSHFATGHAELERTLAHFQQAYWLPDLREEIWSRVRVCSQCVVQKLNADENIVLPKFRLWGNIPFYMLCISFYGPFPRSKSSREYLFVAMDAYSKYVMMKPVKAATDETAIASLSGFMKYLATPTLLACLETKVFRTKKFRNFCLENGIKRAIVPTNWKSSSNSFDKHFVHVKEEMDKLKKTSSEHWDDTILRMEEKVNKSEVEGQLNPEDVLLRYYPVDSFVERLYNKLNGNNEAVPDEEITDEALANLDSLLQEESGEEDKIQYSYKKGDLVLVRHNIPAFTTSKEITSNYRGPYLIKKVLDGNRYVVSDTPMSQLTVSRFLTICSENSLKKWITKDDLNIFRKV